MKTTTHYSEIITFSWKIHGVGTLTYILKQSWGEGGRSECKETVKEVSEVTGKSGKGGQEPRNRRLKDGWKKDWRRVSEKSRQERKAGRRWGGEGIEWGKGCPKNELRGKWEIRGCSGLRRSRPQIKTPEYKR